MSCSSGGTPSQSLWQCGVYRAPCASYFYLPTKVKQRPSEDFMSVGCSDGNVYVWQVPVLKILLLNCGFPSRCVGKMVGQRYWRLVTPPFRVAKYL